MTTAQPLFPRAAPARKFLAELESKLARAVEILSRDKLQVCECNRAKSHLKRIRSWQADPDGVVELAFGFCGENGWGPDIELVCRHAEELEARQRRAA